MLGRKQSIKENVLTDYGEDMLNESADVEWVNKVSRNKTFRCVQLMASTFIVAMGPSFVKALCLGCALLRLS